jgi:hypothetical protein
MSFDWIRFLDTHSIAYSTKGHNVSSGNVVLHCPFCGIQDEGLHMSLSTNNRGWRCFRRPDLHHGKSAVSLVSALIGCSLAQAARICGEDAVNLPEDFMSRVGELLADAPAEDETRELRMPDDLRHFNGKPSCRPFVKYLHSRGYRDLPRFTHLFDVRYATRGYFHHRIVLPIRFKGRLVSFTGRTFDPRADTIRYLTLPTDADKTGKWGIDAAIGPITDYLLWFDECLQADADTLYLVEGPLDAWKVWQLGLDEGIVATCFFTATASPAQIDHLHRLLPKFKHRRLLLDRNTLATSMRLQQQLIGLDVQNLHLPDHLKDPGEAQNLEDII